MTHSLDLDVLIWQKRCYNRTMFEKKIEEGVLYLTFKPGDLDHLISAVFANEVKDLISEQNAMLIIDLCQTAYIDSSGVASLIGILHKIRRYDGKMALLTDQDQHWSIFEIAGLEEILPIHKTKEDAFRSVLGA